MLLEMSINNFILIEEMRIEFGDGVNVLSGETGAGKSMIIDALNLMLGERLKNEYLRDPQQRARIEAVFDLTANEEALLLMKERGLGTEGESEAILCREIHPNGRSSARVNGQAVTAGVLKELGLLLIDLQGQDDRHYLFNPAVYRRHLDRFVPQAENLRKSVAQAFDELNHARRRWEELQADTRQREEMLHSLNRDIAELKAAALRPGEEEELADWQRRAQNAAELEAGCDEVIRAIYRDQLGNSAYDYVYRALLALRRLSSEPLMEALVEPLQDCYYQLEEVAQRVQSFRAQLDFEPERLEQATERLYELRHLKKKYQRDIPALLEHLAAMEQRRDQLVNLDAAGQILLADIAERERAYAAAAEALRAARLPAAELLRQQVDEELRLLNMPDAEFNICLVPQASPGREGLDEVEFMFSANPGELPAPLSKVASGGEISRFLLALKTVLAEEYRIPTLIFDEIDMGIGGATMNALARKIKELSRRHQLIIITHSPQLASFADHHYLIAKERQGERNSVRVQCLNEEERLRELARMQEGDDYSSLALEHAREMIAKSRQ
ncbi:MAG: DNA repair protein RecN [Syntrophomonadaceae bacterium]|nr:DNA repair protein RecN [Syntrophomonadaceae bacterium]